MLGLTEKVRQIPTKGVFSCKAFKIIVAFSAVKERDFAAKVNARRHTLQNKRSLPLRLHP